VKEPVWLLTEVVLATHERLLAEFGGASGIRDRKLLDSALARPKNLFAYGSSTPTALAASYAFGIVKNHPFVDGNKRTGFTLAILFLERNGWRFSASEADATIQTLGLAAGDVSEAGYADWLKTHSQEPRRKRSIPSRRSRTI
jgi:death-on-curing protein